ncbi:MAG: GspE/PulE family protein [Candidatus Paceibacterota bacterium]
MKVGPEQLKEFILDLELATKDELEEAETKAKEENVSLGELLISNGTVSEDDYRRIHAHIMGIPFVDLKDERLDFEVLSIIPEPIARNHNLVAYRKDTNENALEVAMLDTEDLTAIDFIKKKTGFKIRPRLTDKESIQSALRQYQKSLQAEFGDIIQKEANELKTHPDGVGEDDDVTAEELKELAEDVPVVRIVETLLKHAILQNASDIHIEPMDKQVLVRYRIDGILRDAMLLPKEVTNSIAARVKVLANLKLDEKRLPQDGRFKTEMNGEEVSFRVSTLPTQYGEKVVMRLLRQNVSGFTLEFLGFHGVGLEALHKATKETTGMILTTGPTGSGKTTTLYTVLDILNQPGVNISTIEDPVEYQMERINQTQVKPDIGFTFSKGLRALVRQDPDIVMVGEIRDGETASLAVNAALTGHLVLSTLHTNSAAGAIPRLIDMGVEPFLMTSTLGVIVAQRLVRKLTDVKEKYFLTQSDVDSLAKMVDLDHVKHYLKEEGVIDGDKEWTKIPFFKPEASQESDDGYSGRLGIYEVLDVSEGIKELIRQGASTAEIEKHAKEQGMMTMIEDGIFKAAQGNTSVEEVLRVVSE